MTIDSARVSALLAAARDAVARGDHAAALDAAQALLALQPQHAEATVIAVNAALLLERWDTAIPLLEALHAARPAHAPLRQSLASALLRQGTAHERAGRPERAEAAYRRALELGSDDARHNLALLYLAGQRAQEALALLDGVAGDDAALLRARCLIALDRAAEARPLLIAAAAHATRWRRAELLAQVPDADAALALVRDDPGTWQQAAALAEALRHNGDGAASNAILDRALAAHTDPNARFRLRLACCLGLPAVHADAAALAATRAAYAAGLDALCDEFPPQRVRALGLDPAHFAWENFFLAYQGHDDRGLQARWGDWLSGCLAALLPAFAAPRELAPRRRRRVLLVSTFLRQCTVGAYFYSWTKALRATGAETLAVQLGAHADAWTDAFGAATDGLVRLDGSVPELAAGIAALDADLIVWPELGMDARTCALAALRLAPRQACAFGHPSTTGLPTLDAYFSCAAMEPPEAATHYREPLYLLPGLGTAYTPPVVPPRRSRADFGLPDDRALYLLPQSPFKLHPDMDAVLVDLVRRDSSALIVLFGGPAHGATVHLRRRIERAFAHAALDAGAHCRWLPPGSRERYLAVNGVCDVMLDSLHWSGGNASLDALWSGLPIVTAPGALMRGRQSAAMLRGLECASIDGVDLVVEPGALAASAVALAHDRPRREAVRARIAAGLPGLCADPAPLQALTQHVTRLLG